MFLALAAGVSSFLTPCVLPMVPVYLASLAGPEFLEPAQTGSFRKAGFFFHSLSFILGFTAVFTLLGAIAGLTGKFISPNTIQVRLFTGLGLIVLGLFMLAAARFPQFNFEKRLHLSIGRRGYLRSFLAGAIFTFAWTPCVSPILGSILTMALSGNSMWQGSGLLLVYSIGLGIPFLAIGLAADKILPLVRKITRYTIWFYSASGVILVVIGALVLAGRLSLLS